MKKLLILSSFIALFSAFILPDFLPAFAQAENVLRGNDCLYNPGGGVGAVVTMECILPLFANIIYWLILFAGTVAVFFVIFGGIKLLTSSGDPGKVDSARKTIIWAVVGLIVVISSFMIVNIVADVTGVNCISRFGFTNCGGSGSLKPCGLNNPTGYCPNEKQVCVRDSATVYICRYPCGVSRPDGTIGKYCSNGTCTQASTPYGTTYWTCRK